MFTLNDMRSVASAPLEAVPERLATRARITILSHWFGKMVESSNVAVALLTCHEAGALKIRCEGGVSPGPLLVLMLAAPAAIVQLSDPLPSKYCRASITPFI